MTGARLDPAALIACKRDGGEVEGRELEGFLAAYLADEVSEAQMAAFLMAGVIRGFSLAETVTLTDALVASGASIDLSDLAGPTIDKHSTGGVGDTCTLVVAPLLAACGAQVVKLSGRGLGHTGGTLDKLESIPGMRTDLAPAAVLDQAERIGLVVSGATADLVPLDKRLYALRDVTATVPSPALIAASVMSKKIAGGASTIVLDVKAGSGAFMSDVGDAASLAHLCARLGAARGRQVRAVVSDMSQPLAPAVGNALEVAGAVDVLSGRARGPLAELSLLLAASGLAAGRGIEIDEAEAAVGAALASGAAAERFEALVSAQGGDPRVVTDPRGTLPSAPEIGDWRPGPGRVGVIDCSGLGRLAGQLGAGRRRQGAAVDPAVGLEVLKRIGDEVADGEPVVRVHARSRADLDWARETLPRLISLDGGLSSPPLVHAQIGGGDV